MLRHEATPEPETEFVLSLPPLASAGTAVETQRDAHVEDFLDRVFARLVAILPYEERQARRDAMRMQIEQSVAAHVELGSSRQEALDLTLAQIQREQAVASQAVQQVQQTHTRPQRSARPATAIATGVFGLFYLLDQTRIAGHLWNKLFGGMYEHGEIMQNSASVHGFYRFELFVLPLILGLAVGLLAKHRPVRGTLNALALLAIPAIAWGGVASALQFCGILGDSFPEWAKYVFPNPIPAVCGIAFWAVLGALSARAGGWMRSRLPRAQNAVRAMNRRSRRTLRLPRWPSRHSKIVITPDTQPQ